MLAAPLVSAAPAANPKNNEKFETFSVAASFNILTWFAGEKEYIPSMDKVNIYHLSWDETFRTYDISVGSKTYHLNTDFAYSGHVKYTWHDVTAWSTVGGLPPYVWPSESRSVMAIVDYMYDFSAVSGGLDGTIHMLAIMNSAGKWINSLEGTGDFQNVQIKAVIDDSPPNSGLTYYLVHHGTVTGWPE